MYGEMWPCDLPMEESCHVVNMEDFRLLKIAFQLMEEKKFLSSITTW